MKIYTFKNNILAAEWIVGEQQETGRQLGGYCNNPDDKKKKNVGLECSDYSEDGEKWLDMESVLASEPT